MFGVIHMDASADDDPPLESLSDLYDELTKSGISDGNVAVIHDKSGICISVYRDERVVLGILSQNGGDRHMTHVSKDRVIELWLRLINGEIELLLAEHWKPGYSNSGQPALSK